MFDSYFALPFLWAFVGVFGLFASGISFGITGKYRVGIFFLTAGAIVMALTAASFDPYLHLWDEAFHSVVAKNMIAHPLKPTLYEFHAIQTGTPSWAGDHVWLHKQPLFLWQMALSMSIFGVNELAVRIPSALLYVLLIPVGFRSGKLLHSSKAGFVVALMLSSLSYGYQLISGAFLIDHNDVSYVVYVSLSIWAFIEYVHKPNWKWAIAIGLFSGMAVLVKWLTALIVFAGFGLWAFLEKKVSLQLVRHFSLAFMVCLIVFVPWQLFAYLNYTEVFLREMELNSRHFFEAIEGHSGPWYYYLSNLFNLYGVICLLFLSVPFALLKFKKLRSPLLISLAFMVSVIYLFFSVATTKMPTFTFMITLPVLLILAVSLVELYEHYCPQFLTTSWLKPIGFVFMMLFALANINFENLQRYHTVWQKPQSEWRISDLRKTEIFRSYGEKYKDERVVFNLKDFDSVYLMFYSQSIGYNFLPSSEDLERVLSKHPVSIIENGTLPLPDYIRNEPRVEILKDFY